jgi:hypothetical protein
MMPPPYKRNDFLFARGHGRLMKKCVYCVAAAGDGDHVLARIEQEQHLVVSLPRRSIQSDIRVERQEFIHLVGCENA